MIGVELVQVAILWCIAGLASISALNARGLFRQLVSWIITSLIFFAALFFSYMKVENVKSEIGFSGPLPPVIQPHDSVANSSSLTDKVMDTLIDGYNATEKQLMESVMEIASDILAFPEWKVIQAQGIEKRESFESKARFLRNKSMDSYRQIRSLTPPSERKLAYDILLAAADNLRLAGYEVHNQFGQDSDASGESIAKARERATQIKSTVSTIANKE
ncbi:MAG: hypothetical protein FWC15_04345 [Fibromonadales bacterium]|nr:hypothetical protein [Fibromonadales bacterium]